VGIDQPGQQNTVDVLLTVGAAAQRRGFADRDDRVTRHEHAAVVERRAGHRAHDACGIQNGAHGGQASALAPHATPHAGPTIAT
jgi:hypothetical protein